MELSLPMRYVMTQTQKEAPDDNPKVEHLFLALMALSKKTAQELTSNVQMQILAHLEIIGLQSQINNKHRLQVDAIIDKLGFLLQDEPSKAEKGSFDLLFEVMEMCKRQGNDYVTSVDVLNWILKSPTPLIKKAIEATAITNDKLPWNEAINTDKAEIKAVEKEAPSNKVRHFCYKQCQYLFLPLVGLLLMWYFDWLPMKPWVIWAYCIYGVFIWLFRTARLLLRR